MHFCAVMIQEHFRNSRTLVISGLFTHVDYSVTGYVFQSPDTDLLFQRIQSLKPTLGAHSTNLCIALSQESRVPALHGSSSVYSSS